jgi:geranylgeranyl diphosphate synthase, type II
MTEDQEKAGLWHYVESKRPQIEKSLREFLPLAPVQIKTKFNDALEYALFPGGKRLRPVLTMLGAELVGGRADEVTPSAIAVEYVHTSSLIFDDLPCMDDARERRGKTSLHEKFGEGLAVLVGLGFLNASYGLVFVNHSSQPERAIKAHAELVECIGAAGMVGGQAVDLALAQGAGGDVSAQNYESESVRNLKTSALMRLALRVGAILAGANDSQLISLSRYAELLGDSYQLSDDLLDLEEDGEIFSQNQTTFAIEKGRDAAQVKLKTMVEEAKEILIDNFAPSPARDNLEQLTDYLAERKA